MTVQQAVELGLAHHQAGRLAEAEALYREVLARQAHHADALHLLGVLAHQTGRQELAVEMLSRVIALVPNHAAVHSNLGEAYRALGRLEEAVACYQRALQLKPDDALAHYNLGNARQEQGQLDEAVAAYRRSLEFQPDYAEAHNNLGIALARSGQNDAAIEAYRRAVQLAPAQVDAWTNLGLALAGMGRCAEAADAYWRALELAPQQPEAHTHLGNALRAQGRLDEAMAAYRGALELQPERAETHAEIGVTLMALGRLDEALAALNRAIQLNPRSPATQINLGNVLKDRGQLDEALAAFRRALEMEPENAAAHSNLIYTLHFDPGADARTIAAEQESWNRRFAEPLKRGVRPHANDRDPHRRLRIGYVSADFRDHVIGRNLMPLFKGHDRETCEIVCYSGVVQPDDLTGQFRERAHQWRSTLGVGDEALAEMIRHDGVDILVDLAQHMAGNRLTMFGCQPAPVQVSFAGYPASTGVAAIEYRLSDRFLEEGDWAGEGPASQGFDVVLTRGKEQVHCLECFWCFDPCGLAVEVNALPWLTNGSVTFGSLNNFAKVNDGVLQLWAKILSAVKNSRLILLSPEGSHRERVLATLARAGVDASRVELVAPRARRAYLELYHRIDIALDPFPYNGHTTSLDALWMGVPVVTMAGERAVSRAGLSLLANLGWPDFVSRDEKSYIETAVELAREPSRLQEMRRALRPAFEQSVLTDAARFARSIETAYRRMWQQWCQK